MNLKTISSEQQRLFVLLAIGVVAVAGLFLVTRGGGSEGSSAPSTPPAKSSPAKPDQAKASPSKSAPDKSGAGKESSAAKPSKQAYLDCVQQATNTAALEKCQAVLP